MSLEFYNENIIEDFIYEIKFGTNENANKYLSESISVNYFVLKNILCTNCQLNINYLNSYYFDNSKNIKSVLIINMDKQNEILHFYLKKEKNYFSTYKIYKIEKE